MVIKLNLPCGLYQPHADIEKRKSKKFRALRIVVEMIYDMITLRTWTTEAFVVKSTIYTNHVITRRFVKVALFLEM